MKDDSCITQNRNNSIDLFRYLCAIMVVIIHSSFWHNWGIFGIFIGDVFPRIAVPFFFATSGYFYIKKLTEGSKVFFTQLKHVFLIYALWSLVYFSLDFFNQIILDGRDFIPFLKNFIFSFLIFGSTGHFWFFPALIISICIITLIYKCKLMKFLIPLSILLYIIGCLGCAYFELAKHIPVLNLLYKSEHFNTLRRIFLMGFPFFSMGYLLQKIEKWSNNKSLIIAWLIATLLFICEIIVVLYFEIDSTIVITFGLYILLLVTMRILLNNPLPRYANIAKVSKTLANITYYSHPFFQICLTVFSKFTNISIPSIIEFILVLMLTSLLGYVLYELKRRKDWKFIDFIIG